MIESQNILVIDSRFYEDISDQLCKGAIAVLDREGAPYETISVPGTFEIPAAVRFAIRSMEVRSAVSGYAGFIVLGCVIRGETDHYEHISRQTCRALMDLSVNYSIAMGFGILTCENREQAMDRAAVDRMNKGADAANACLRMIELKKTLRLVLR